METPYGRVPKRDPLEALNSAELLAFYGMCERAATRLRLVAYISGWGYYEWQPTADDLDTLAFHAYEKLFHRVQRGHIGQPFVYMLPGKDEWPTDESGESD